MKNVIVIAGAATGHSTQFDKLLGHSGASFQPDGMAHKTLELEFRVDELSKLVCELLMKNQRLRNELSNTSVARVMPPSTD